MGLNFIAFSVENINSRNIILLIFTGAVTNGNDLYISRVLGNDTRSCDQQSKPCKSIWRAVTLASHGDRIHLDGTNTNKDPYTCQSGVSQHLGIYINKSVSLIGSASPMPQIRCTEGTGLTFNGSDNVAQMNATLSGLLVNESYVKFYDSSVNIDGCKFEDNKQGMLIVTRTSSIQITNSTFSGNSDCISVVVNSSNSQSQYIKVKFKLMNSSFEGNVLSDEGSCISFTESPYYNKQPVSYDITLENVTFSHNKFSSKGLVFLEMKNGNQHIKFQNVILIDNRPSSGRDVLTGDGDSECIVRSADVNIFIDSSNFTSHHARLFNVSASNISLQIYNSSFVGHKVQGGGGVIFLRGTDLCRLNVSKSWFAYTTAAQGGAVSIECASVDRVSFKENIFKDNTAKNGEGGAVYIYSPGSLSNHSEQSTDNDEVEDSVQGHKLLHINVTKCNFTSAFSFFGGGGIHIKAVRVSMRLRYSAFINCTSTSASYGGGGVLIDTSLTSVPKRKPGNDLLLIVEDSHFMGCRQSFPSFTKFCGSLCVLFKTQIEIIINNSYFISNSGGAVAIQSPSNYSTTGVSYVKIEHSTFLKNIFSSAIVILLYNRSIVSLKNVTMESSIGLLGSSTVIRYNCTVRIHQCRFLKNTNAFAGGVMIVSLTELEVRDSLFEGNHADVGWGGALYLVGAESSSSISIAIFNTTFNSCSAGYMGGAIFLNFLNQITNLEIKRCRFVENSVFNNVNGYGGAILYSASDTKVNLGCSQQEFFKSCHIDNANKFPSWNYKNQFIFEKTTFERNTAGAGGAVYLINGKATFRNCYFIDNFAADKGGHLYTASGSASVVLQESVFRQTKNELQLLKVTSFVHAESSGELVFYNTTMDAAQPYDSAIYSTLVLIQNGGLIDLGDNNVTKFTCPLGNKIDITNFTTCQLRTINSTCKITVNTRYLRYDCLRCTENKYSLQRGSAFGGHLVPGFQCLPCPFGANCSKNIHAKPNFWGFLNKTVNPPTLKFTMCPLGYCSPPQNVHEYNGCQGNRSGELCGQCNDAYTETLYSTDCRPSHKCKDYWFWPVTFVYVSFMAFYFIFTPPIVPWIKRQLFWFKKQETANEEDDFDRGYLKILFYFYQAGNLLLVSNSEQQVFKTKFVDIFVGLFNFQQKFSPSGLICPFRGLTVVTKQLFSAFHVFGTYLMIGVFYCFHWGVQKCRGREAPSVGPYIGGILQTMLLGYTTLTSVSFNLLRCVPIGSKKHLFYDGNVTCYQWWQYILIGFVCSFFVPFVFVLLWGSFKLYDGIISLGIFLLACCFPLPYLLSWAFVSLFGTARNATHEGSALSQVSRKTAERVLYEPFKRPEDGRKLALSWESVIIGRRLVLIVLKAFVSDPMPRLFIMSFLCVLFLQHHSMIQPFRDGVANKVETISLLSLVLLGMVNAFIASFLSLAVPLNSHFSSWWTACQWIETIIVCAVPAIFGLFVVTAVLSLMGRLFVVSCRFFGNLFWVCFTWCCRKQNVEMRPLMALKS